MAKQSTPCEVCGGSTDGTPSGKDKHFATAKHQSAVIRNQVRNEGKVSRGPVGVARAAAMSDDYSDPDEPVTAAQALAQSPLTGIPESKPINAGHVAFDLRGLIAEKQAALRRRQASLKWVQNNQTAAQADAYAESKVDPLLREIDTLAQARDLISTLA